jgi:hypothetical protein
MRPNVFIAVLILCAAGAGCGTFFADATRNLTEAPVRACDDAHLRKHTRHLARAAWAQYVRAHAEQQFSKEFADGFKDGFADYLYEGGNGQPPAVPPFAYQLRRYEMPEGQTAIDQWYSGFAAGSAAAIDSGERNNIVVPLSAPPVDAARRRAGGPPGPAPAPADELPPPRPLGPGPPSG